jgi:hypothetical protein
MANLGPAPKVQFFNTNGDFLVGGKVYTYAAGTTTPLETYTDSSSASLNSNPVILNARGEANIWFGAGVYKVKLTDSNDVEIWTVDNVAAYATSVSPAFTGSTTISATTSTPALTVTQTGPGPVVRFQDSSDPDSTPFIIASNGYVGIGTASPISELEVNGTITGAWAYLPSGTTMMFIQAVAPTGWTKSTTHNNKALRIVSGAGGGSGGTIDFTTAFNVVAVSGTVGGHALTIDEIPSHNHLYTSPILGAVAVSAGGLTINNTGVASGTGTGSTGNNQTHTHTFTGTVDMSVKYVDAIIAVKD